MKKSVFICLALFFAFSVTAQDLQPAFKSGEWLKFRVRYGFLNASYITLNINTKMLDTVPVYHAVGRGKTTGFASIFFKVDDTYESYFDQGSGKPYKFIRKINEGGYTKDIEIDFRHEEDIAILKDNKRGTKTNIPIHNQIQDLISAAYHLRNSYDFDKMKDGNTITLDMLFDDDGIYTFQLKFLGKERLRTRFGKVECLKFRPYVQSGRVFKEKESLTLWISNDLNKIPIRIKANLAIGSLKAELYDYSSLRNPFKAKE